MIQPAIVSSESGRLSPELRLEPLLVQVGEGGQQSWRKQFQRCYGECAGKNIISSLITADIGVYASKVPLPDVERECSGTADRLGETAGLVFVVSRAGLSTGWDFFAGCDENVSETLCRTVLNHARENGSQSLSNLGLH